MSVRKRTWVTRRGERREVWIADYSNHRRGRSGLWDMSWFFLKLSESTLSPHTSPKARSAAAHTNETTRPAPTMDQNIQLLRMIVL